MPGKPRRRATGTGSDLRQALIAYLEDRVDWYARRDRLRVKFEDDGAVVVYPGLVWLEKLRAGRPVDLHGLYLLGAARRAGLDRSLVQGVDPGRLYRVEPDGRVSRAHSRRFEVPTSGTKRDQSRDETARQSVGLAPGRSRCDKPASSPFGGRR